MANIAAARKVTLTEVRSTVTGDIDLNGILGLQDVRNGYQQGPPSSSSRATLRRGAARHRRAVPGAPPSTTSSPTAWPSTSRSRSPERSGAPTTGDGLSVTGGGRPPQRPVTPSASGDPTPARDQPPCAPPFEPATLERRTDRAATSRRPLSFDGSVADRSDPVWDGDRDDSPDERGVDAIGLATAATISPAAAQLTAVELLHDGASIAVVVVSVTYVVGMHRTATSDAAHTSIRSPRASACKWRGRQRCSVNPDEAIRLALGDPFGPVVGPVNDRVIGVTMAADDDVGDRSSEGTGCRRPGGRTQRVSSFGIPAGREPHLREPRCGHLYGTDGCRFLGLKSCRHRPPTASRPR